MTHPATPPLRLGKKPARHDPRDLLYTAYRQAGLVPPPPTRFGHEALVADWGMLGNDQWGDCVFAGADHETMLWNAEADHPIQCSPDGALADYGAVTGFDPHAGPPGSNPTDQGTDVRNALNYRRATGIVDAAGQRHKLGGYVALEPGNWQHLIEAAYVFSAVGIGLRFPNSAMAQFQQGQPWTVVGGAQIEGGHYVPVVGCADPETGRCVTWGRAQLFTRQFYETYADEAFALLSPEMLGPAGLSLEGINAAQLQADLQALSGGG